MEIIFSVIMIHKNHMMYIQMKLHLILHIFIFQNLLKI